MQQVKVELDKFKSDAYVSASDAKFRKPIWYFVNAIFFQSALFPISPLKTFLLRLFGAKVGKGVNIKPMVSIKYPWRLSIGDHVWIGEKVWIANEGEVKIGNHVCISHECLILSGGHNYKKKYFDVYANPIIIEDGVWLGARSGVGGGITIGSHAVLSFNSVANRDLEPYGIYRGNPATKIKERTIE